MKFGYVMMAAALVAAPLAVGARQAPDAAARMAAQRQALAPLAWMDGTWRGRAEVTGADGKVHQITQTERVGPLLDGSIKLIEGRGYGADGRVVFRAFAVVSWDAPTRAFHFQSHAMGHSGDFTLVPTAEGFRWEIPAGPMTIRYVVTHADGQWHEVGEQVMPGQPPVRIYDATLRRIGDSAWPGAGAVPAR